MNGGMGNDQKCSKGEKYSDMKSHIETILNSIACVISVIFSILVVFVCQGTST